jgi:hypothetical protein
MYNLLLLRGLTKVSTGNFSSGTELDISETFIFYKIDVFGIFALRIEGPLATKQQSCPSLGS